MRAELRKIICLPTPRWVTLAVLAAVIVAAGAVALMGAGTEDFAPTFGLALPPWIASIVIGVWLVGVEYGQKTMRRTLSRNPDRLKLVLVKGMLGVLAAVLLTALATVVATPLFVIASAGHELKVTAPELLRAGLGSLVNNVMVVLIALSLGLLTRSMAGGMALALGYFFVIDTLLAEIPFIGPYMFGAASSEVFSNISGDRFTEGISALGPVLAAVMTIAWAAAFLTAASVRFIRADVE